MEFPQADSGVTCRGPTPTVATGFYPVGVYQGSFLNMCFDWAALETNALMR